MSLLFEKRNFLFFYSYILIGVVYLFFSLLVEVGNSYLSLCFVVTTTIIATVWCQNRNLFQILWLLSIYIFFTVPFIVLTYVGYTFHPNLIFSIVLVSGYPFWISYGRTFEYEEIGRSAVPDKVFWFYFLFMLIGVAFFYRFGMLLLFPVAVFLFCITLKRNRFWSGVLMLLALFSMIFLYMFFIWEGFGRLMLASWALIPMFFFFLFFDIKIRKTILVPVVSLASIFATFMRFEVKDLNDLLHSVSNDSTTAPVRHATSIYQLSSAEHFSSNVSGMADQFSMFIVGALPRFVWPSKPFGFGYEYVVAEMPAVLADHGHSIAALFLGEQIYYTGIIWGTVAALVSVSILVFMHNFLFSIRSSFKGLYTMPLLMWTMSFYWAGIATFSQRFQQSFLLVLIVLLVARLKPKKELKSEPRGFGV